MSDVNIKSTKQQIYGAYQDALKELKDLKSTQLDPKAEKAKVRAAEVKKATEPEAVDDALSMLKQASVNIEETVGVIKTEYKKLSEVEEAIEIRSRELKELYGIEAEAESLAALVDSHRRLKDELELEIGVERDSWAEEQALCAKEHSRALDEMKKAQQREEESWKYDFERRKRQEHDSFRDELAEERKAFDAEMEMKSKEFRERLAALEKREEEVTGRETKQENLEMELERLKATRESDIEVAAASARDKARASYAIETNALKKGHEAEVTVLTARADTLLEQVRELREENSGLSAKLSEAYAKIQDVALKSLESQGNARMVEQLSRSVSAEQARPKN
jgi:colicin import membrane protein